MSEANPASTVTADGCGAPAGGVSVSAAAGTQAVVEGRVTREGAPVGTGYARLLGTGDEFVAEVPLGDDGGVRVVARSRVVDAARPGAQRAAGRAVGAGGQRPGDHGRGRPLATRRQMTGAAAAS